MKLNTTKSLEYIPHIDGLRCLAVVSVLLYHATLGEQQVPLLAGGFLGVDIFFVISGFLITRIIVHELECHTFTITSFYERRIRRILPALYAVIFTTLPFAYTYLLPKAFKEYAYSVLTTLVFGSNIYFAVEDAYTAEASLLKPMLHTWSLAIEEQFYLLFPCLLIIIFRKKWPTITVLAALLLLSVVAASVGALYWPDLNFYLLLGRMWELLAGALLAIGWHNPALQQYAKRSAGVALGAFIVLLGCFYLYHDTFYHPSIVTMVPIGCVVALIVFAQQPGTVVHTLLTLPTVRHVGKLSYSLYLWHVPVFVFYRIVVSPQIDLLTYGGLLALAYGLSLLSYHTVEQPFRNKKTWSFKPLIAVTGVASVVLAMASGAIILNKGFASRLPAIIAKADVASEWWALKDENGQPCHRGQSVEPCVFRWPAKSSNHAWQVPNDVVLIGDSHAGVLARSLHHQLRDNGAHTFRTFVWGGCPLVKNVKQQQAGVGLSCAVANRKKLAALQALPPSTIVVSQRMGYWLSGSRFNNQEGGIELGEVNPLVPTSGTLRYNLTGTIRDILAMGHTVVLVYPIPEVGYHVPKTLLKQYQQFTSAAEMTHWLRDEGLTTSLDVYLARNKQAFDAYDALGKHERLIRIYPHQLLCGATERRCKTHSDASIYYSDDDHLSFDGAELITEQVIHKIN